MSDNNSINTDDFVELLQTTPITSCKKPRGRPPKPKTPKEPKEPKVLKTADRKTYNKEYNKKYYAEKRQDITPCDICGGKYEKYNKANHELTNRHIFIYNKINNII
jgi:hypothetical protein